MASYLSNAQKNFINEVIDDVFDTFSREIVVYSNPQETVISTSASYNYFYDKDIPQVETKEFTTVKNTFQAKIKYLDQSKANLFQQTQSQDALARAGLPPTTVTPGDISQRVTGTAKDIGDLQLQSKVAGLTQDGLAYVGDLVTDVGTNLIEEALDATGISGLWNTAKQKFNALFPKITTARKKAVQTNAVKRGATSGRPTIQVPIDIDQG